ncbi:hypothetical protein K1X76_06240 [bacterium]|nr:hypothetical protein [bacterium]
MESNLVNLYLNETSWPDTTNMEDVCDTPPLSDAPAYPKPLSAFAPSPVPPVVVPAARELAKDVIAIPPVRTAVSALGLSVLVANGLRCETNPSECYNLYRKPSWSFQISGGFKPIPRTTTYNHDTDEIFDLGTCPEEKTADDDFTTTTELGFSPYEEQYLESRPTPTVVDPAEPSADPNKKLSPIVIPKTPSQENDDDSDAGISMSAGDDDNTAENTDVTDPDKKVDAVELREVFSTKIYSKKGYSKEEIMAMPEAERAIFYAWFLDLLTEPEEGATSFVVPFAVDQHKTLPQPAEDPSHEEILNNLHHAALGLLTSTEHQGLLDSLDQLTFSPNIIKETVDDIFPFKTTIVVDGEKLEVFTQYNPNTSYAVLKPKYHLARVILRDNTSVLRLYIINPDGRNNQHAIAPSHFFREAGRKATFQGIAAGYFVEPAGTLILDGGSEFFPTEKRGYTPNRQYALLSQPHEPCGLEYALAILEKFFKQVSIN